MRRRPFHLGCAAASLAAALAGATPARAGSCSVGGVEITADAHAQRVVIRTGCMPRFAVLRLHEPERIVIDLPQVDAQADFGRLPVRTGAIDHVDVRAVLGPSGPIGRVVVGLRSDEPYDIVREGQDIVVVLPSGRRDPVEVAAAPSPTRDVPPLAASEAGAPDPTLGEAPPPAAQAAPSPAAQTPAAFAQAPTAAPQADDEPAPASFFGLRRVGDAVRIELGSATRFATQQVDSPARFVVDLPDAAASGALHALGKRPAWLSRVRLGRQTHGIRLVFDLRRRVRPSVQADAHGLLVRPHAAPSTARVLPQARHLQASLPQVTDLRFEEARTTRGVESRVFVATSASALPPCVERRNPHALVLAFSGLALPAHLEKGLDTRASAGPVSLVSSYQAQRDPPSTHIVVSLKHDATQDVQRVPGGFVWTLRSAHGATVMSHASRAMSHGAEDAHDGPNEAADGRSRLANKRISLDVKDAEVANVLRLMSEETGENIIASDEVRGKVTLKLRNVPAEQALDTLLRVKGFDRVRSHNILRVASAETIQKERDAEVARKRALVEVEEVAIKMVTINYATASEVVEQLKPMLSGRGSVQVDSRTNTLILQDISSNIDNLADLAHRLDKQTPLVNIQARIVEADSTFVRDLGVQWGGAVKHTAVAGNPTGLYFPADVTAQGAADFTTGAAAGGGGSGAVVAPSRYAVNLPASLTGSGAALGFIMGSAGGSHLLDLRLSAMETNGNGKVISSPEVSTLDNRTARVSQGVSFAVSTVSAAGTNVKFIPAVLELEVTPHVTNDGTVLLKLHVQKSAPDFANRSGQGDPSIQTKEAQTEVLVKDGDTSVIGGILTRNTSQASNEVPFLSKIPLLGRLFREHSQRDTRSELLVFITPRIINRDESRLTSDVAVAPR